MFSKVLVCSCLLGFDDRLGLCRQGEGRGDKNMGEGTTPFLACSVLASVFYSFMQVLFGGDLVAKSCLTLVTPWTVACQAPLSMGVPRRLSFPSPGDLPNPGIEPRSPALQVDSLPTEAPGKPKCW